MGELRATRIDGEPLDCVDQSFVHDLMAIAAKYRGRVLGFHLLLLIDSDDGTSEIRFSQDWPSYRHLLGALFEASQAIAAKNQASPL